MAAAERAPGRRRVGRGRQDLFKSALSEMPEDACSSSSEHGTTMGGGKSSKHLVLEEVRAGLKRLSGGAAAAAAAAASEMKEKRARCPAVASLTEELNKMGDQMEALEEEGKEGSAKYKQLKRPHAFLNAQYGDLTGAVGSDYIFVVCCVAQRAGLKSLPKELA